ncbi:MAG TPA: hypothetical protein VKT77_20405, partial [Chthonomonadaceae bacterium]|nr:hypothetical protein [Chthonomonadaceae bacterium]
MAVFHDNAASERHAVIEAPALFGMGKARVGIVAMPALVVARGSLRFATVGAAVGRSVSSAVVAAILRIGDAGHGEDEHTGAGNQAGYPGSVASSQNQGSHHLYLLVVT